MTPHICPVLQLQCSTLTCWEARDFSCWKVMPHLVKLEIAEVSALVITAAARFPLEAQVLSSSRRERGRAAWHADPTQPSPASWLHPYPGMTWEQKGCISVFKTLIRFLNYLKKKKSQWNNRLLPKGGTQNHSPCCIPGQNVSCSVGNITCTPVGLSETLQCHAGFPQVHATSFSITPADLYATLPSEKLTT